MADETQEYEIPMLLTYRVTVTVDAKSPDEARDTAMRTAWFDNGLDRGELSNWQITGEPRQSYP